MTSTLDEYKRKRDYLELVQGEFRRLAIQYPPLRHERFLTPATIEDGGWEAFVASRPQTSEWEDWHGPRDGYWYGRFFGRSEGLDEFKQLCGTLSQFFPRLNRDDAVAQWIEVVHEIAEMRPSPLLSVTRRVWNWDMEDYFDDEYGGYEVPEPYTRMLVFRKDIGVQYPKHPLQRILKFNVFTSSVAALQIIMEPHLVIPEGDSYDELPLVLLPPQSEPESLTALDEKAIFAVGDGDLPPYLFRKSGNIWALRFTSKNKLEKGCFSDLAGLSHYQKLLLSPTKTISCVDLDPEPDTADMAAGSCMTLEDLLDEGESFEDYACWGAISEPGVDATGKELLDNLKKQRKELKEKIAGIADEAAKSAMELQQKQLTKLINVMGGKVNVDEKSLHAYFRVKQVMLKSRQTLGKNGMKGLERHLSQTVQRVGWGYRYDPKPEPNWQF